MRERDKTCVTRYASCLITNIMSTNETGKVFRFNRLGIAVANGILLFII